MRALSDLQTTDWTSHGAVQGLTAGALYTRLFAGLPEARFEDATWAAASAIPWSALPASLKPADVNRVDATIPVATNLAAAPARVVIWQAGIFLPAAQTAAVRGIIRWTL